MWREHRDISCLSMHIKLMILRMQWLQHKCLLSNRKKEGNNKQWFLCCSNGSFASPGWHKCTYRRSCLDIDLFTISLMLIHRISNDNYQQCKDELRFFIWTGVLHAVKQDSSILFPLIFIEHCKQIILYNLGKNVFS